MVSGVHRERMEEQLSSATRGGNMKDEGMTGNGRKESRESLCGSLTGQGCGLKKVLDIIGGKWKVLILCLLDDRGRVRYNEMRREIFGITSTMLAQSLREMEEDGLVLRHQYEEMPVRVEYMLTDRAKSMIPILLELKAWGEKYL